MSWMARLHETYESGVQLELPEDRRLTPSNHINQNAHIRIVLNGEGTFRRAEILPKKTSIILPVTERSETARTSGEAPHPLADKVQYVAKDYSFFGGKKKSYFNSYYEQINQWAESKYANDKIKAIRDYVAKGEVVKDLINHEILIAGDENILLTEWESNQDEPPKLFKILPKEKGKFDQGDALVCWSIEIPDQPSTDTWRDEEIQTLWMQYEQSKLERTGEGEKALCFISGNEMLVSKKHPKLIGQKKLVSSNDTRSGFTFRGRFLEELQAMSVGALITQKAHNALRWLINRQGYRNGDQIIVAWAISGEEIPDPMKGSFALLDQPIEESVTSDETSENTNANIPDAGQYFSNALSKRLAGYQAKLSPCDNIIIMGLDSVTKGRMAITYYQEFAPEDFLSRLQSWYDDFAWYQWRTIKDQENREKEKAKGFWQLGTASPKEIVEAVYGHGVSDSLKKNTIERLLPCIMQGQLLPSDMVKNAVQNAVNRHSYKSDEQWQWKKNLDIACSLYKGFSKRKLNRRYSMALEEDNHSRDYLYGRLLAIAEHIEENALNVAGEERNTTAVRLMQRFADRPASTWRNIELALQPYMQRLKTNHPEFLLNQRKLLDGVVGSFSTDDFNSDKPLSGEFLLAYHSQRKSQPTTESVNNSTGEKA